MLFYYVRHGDPIYTPDSLTPLGERQAEAVAKRLALHGIDKVFASTSNRAILTATPTAQICKKEIVQLDFANESHAWEGFTYKAKDRTRWLFQCDEITHLFHTKEIRELGHEWYKHPALSEYNYKEGVDRVQRESDAFFESLGYKRVDHGKYEIVRKNNDRVAMFAHQGFGLAFLSCVLGFPYPHFCTHFDILHTGVTAIEFGDIDGYSYPVVRTFSSEAHIYREGLPTRIQNERYF